MRARAAVPLLLVVFGGLQAHALSGQTITLDEGGFRLLVGGQGVGTETFSIRQNGTGESAVVIASGRITMDATRGAQEINAQLQMAGPALRPAAYQVDVQGANAERIAGRVIGGRFSATIVSSAGEQMREYVASEGAVVVDEGVAHHYYFLAQRVGSESARVPILIPRLSKQLSATVTARGDETITVAGASLTGRHLVVNIPGTPDRHVWVDAKGRVLRFEIPDSKFIAERTAAPK